jgi:hypothetical protein
LETAYLWQDQVVCHECHGRLSAQAQSQVEPEAPELADTAIGEIVDEVPEVPPDHYGNITPLGYHTPAIPAGPDPIFCPNPNCGYRGRGRRRPKGSTVVLVVLLLCGVLLGILYAIFTSGDEILCPRCGIKVREERHKTTTGDTIAMVLVVLFVVILLMIMLS